MEARKCDRCGEFYELSKEDQERKGWPVDTKGAIARLYLRPGTDNSGEWYDLCPECVKSLQEWLGIHDPSYKFLDKTETCPVNHCRGCNRLSWGNGPDNPYYECHKYNTKVKFFSKQLNDLIPEDFKKDNSVGDPYEDGGL